MTRVVVIGAGFGGLAAAYALQAAGCTVTVVERQQEVGGKARTLSVAGHRVPAGPTVLTLREIFDRLFGEAGDRLDEHVTLTPLERLAHHRWGDGSRLDLFHSVEESAAAIADFAGAAEADGYRRFVADAARVYATVEKPFIHAIKPDLFALARATGPFGAKHMKPFETYWSALSHHFRDPRLRQLFGRYATYCGASPFAAPATLMLVAHAEQRGVWTVGGGLSALAKAMAERFLARGGTLRLGEEAGEIKLERGAVRAVELKAGALEADAVVVNADVSALGAGHFGRAVSRAAPEVPEKARSLSAVALSLAAAAPEPLSHHTVCFSDDYPAEFDALFKARRMPAEPTVYACAPEGAAPGEKQPILIVMNAPATGERTLFAEEARTQCENQALARLRACQIPLTVVSRTVTTPTDFAAILPATAGALYGRASHGWTASFQRPAIRTKIQGLYLAGGSAHPGPGVPMATLSGATAARALIADFGLMSQSSRAGMSGGTSTA